MGSCYNPCTCSMCLYNNYIYIYIYIYNICYGHTNTDSLVDVNSCANFCVCIKSCCLLKQFSKLKAGDLISYWTASMFMCLMNSAFKVYVEYLRKHNLCK